MNFLEEIKAKLGGAWKSVSLNLRDIVSTLLWIIAILFVTQVIAIVGDKVGIDLHDLKSFVFAIGKFAAVVLCGVGYLTHITFRQSLGEHDLNEFLDTWKNVLTPKDRIEWFFKISIAGLIAAALVFAIGV